MATKVAIHERMKPNAMGVPYFDAVQGPDGKYWWAECPRCGEIVKNKDGYGPGRHWAAREGRA